MRFALLLLFLSLCACSQRVIQTRDRPVACYEGSRLKLNTVLDPAYKLVFTGTYYELRLVDSNKRVAKFTRCEIEIIQQRPAFDAPDTR